METTQNPAVETMDQPKVARAPRTTRRVLVTGASTGIGRATVGRLADDGAFVWAGVGREEDAHALETAHPGHVEALVFDVTDQEAVARAGTRVRAAGPLHGLVNNAGVALPAPLEFMPLEEFRRQIEVNLVGQLAVTQAALPALRAATELEGGPAPRIVMIGSIGDRLAGPIIGAYHAAKFGLAGLTGSLRAELAPSGIDVVLVEPGTIATPIWSRGRSAGDRILADLPPEATQRYGTQLQAVRNQAERAARTGLPPAAVAEVIVTALTAPRPRARYLVGRDARMAAMLAYLPDRAREWVLARVAGG